MFKGCWNQSQNLSTQPLQCLPEVEVTALRWVLVFSRSKLIANIYGLESSATQLWQCVAGTRKPTPVRFALILGQFDCCSHESIRQYEYSAKVCSHSHKGVKKLKMSEYVSGLFRPYKEQTLRADMSWVSEFPRPHPLINFLLFFPQSCPFQNLVRHTLQV